MTALKKKGSWFSGLLGRFRLKKPICIDSKAALDVGLVRDNNEDSYLSLPDYNLWAVADGMGGSESGEIASAIAINHLKKAVVAGTDLVTAIEQCHQAIVQATDDKVGEVGMGTTLVALKVQGKQYQIAWVGDSRCYLYRSNLQQLSKDHSYVQLLLDQGIIKPSEIDNHPYKNAITQALGGNGDDISVDSLRGDIQRGDVFLLCSDGLSGEVSDAVIAEVLAEQGQTLETQTKQLVDQALLAGGGDNIAVVLVEIGVKK